MAAEVLASALRLDLFRVDLRQVVSRHIDEAEKDLRRIFDAAEASGAILLFDEADALFGPRAEVKDRRDRYASLEISYLLQRMETYRGLAILTTNLKSAVDPAFLRRLRFVVDFPFPMLRSVGNSGGASFRRARRSRRSTMTGWRGSPSRAAPSAASPSMPPSWRPRLASRWAPTICWPPRVANTPSWRSR
ncbi:ATP-binding protein [Pseudoroseomonas wenyumeiae]